MLVRRPFLAVFFGLRKIRFKCQCTQFKFNLIILVLKLLPTTNFIIVKTLVQIHFVEASLWRIQMLVRRPSLAVFFGLRKVRFQCQCAQFKFNQIVFCSDYFYGPFLSSLKLWFRYLSQKSRYGGFKCWFEGLFSQFFSDYEKYVSNASVLSLSSI